MAAVAPPSYVVFGSRLLQQLLQRKEENVFVSPASVGLALSMAAVGARGKTLASFERALGVDVAWAANWATNLLASVDSLPRGVAVELANSLWAPATLPLSGQYIDAMRKSYRAEVRNLDFTMPGAVKVVNDWVARATHGQIDNAVDSIGAATVMLLVNATYFHGLWQHPFDSEQTEDHKFTTGSGGMTEVRLMQRRGSFSYMQDSELQAVMLPYTHGRFHLLVVLPRAPLSPAAFHDIAAASSLTRIRDGLESTEGRLGLPKVGLAYSANLVPELLEMGLAPAFAQDADFSAIFEEDIPSFISGIMHKTLLEIDEKGTTAAASTVIERSLSLSLTPPPRPFEMIVDKPFLLALTDNETDLILFLGVIGNPNP